MDYTAVVQADESEFLITAAGVDGTPDLGRVIFDPVVVRGTDEAGEYLPRLGWTALGGGWEAGSGLVWRPVRPDCPRHDDEPEIDWETGV